MSNLSSLLNKNGLLIMEIPNKYFLGFVASDGHFGLFGITLLDHLDATKYFEKFFDFSYDVGEYYDLDYYIKVFKQLGCVADNIQLKGLQDIYGFKDLPKFILNTCVSYLTFLRNFYRIPIKTSAIIHFNFFKYILSLTRDYLFGLLSSKRKKIFLEKYLSRFWI